MEKLSNKKSAIIRLLLFIILSQGIPVSAQTTAHWDWAYSLFGVASVTSSCQSQSICVDTAGTFYTAGTFLGSTLIYFPNGLNNQSVIEYFGSTTHTDGYIFNYDTAGHIIGSYSVLYASGNVNLSRIITDKNNNIYLAGTFDGTDFHPNGGTLMLNFSPAATTTDIFINKINHLGVGIWAVQAGGTSADNVTDICVDSNLNVYVTGYYNSPYIVFGTDTLHNSNGNVKFFVTKYNSSGTALWTKGAINTGTSQGPKICTDNQGAVYVTGYFWDSLNFGGTILVNSLQGTTATFLAKLDTSGNLLWLKAYYGGSTPSGVVSTSRHDIYLSGDFGTASMQFDTFTVYNPVSSANSELFITRIDSGGHVKWANNFGGTHGLYSYGLAADAYDNGYVTGFTKSASVVCGNDTIHDAHPSLLPVGFILKFDSSGHGIYIKSANPADSSDLLYPTSIAVNKRGDAYITGSVRADTVAFGPINMETILSPPYEGCFNAKIDSVPNCVCSMSALSTTTFCAGDSVILSASGGTGSSWQWFRGSSQISGATGSHYSAQSTGVYSVHVTNSIGCVATSSSISVTVNPLPLAGGITGSASVCASDSISLTDTVNGGSWSTTNGNAFVVTTGVVHGVSAGIDTIKYTVTNTCGAAIATKTVTINTLPFAGTITGANSVCLGDSTALTDTVSGGSWSAANGHAFVSVNGEVHGISVGTDTIKYSVTNTCGTTIATKIITVNTPYAGTISGLDSVCIGNTITLTDTTNGGSWSAANGHALVSGGGSVLGISAGTDTISYTVTNTCGAATVTKIVTINPLSFAGIISGANSVCVSDTISLTDSTGGGSWSATNGNAFVSVNGVIFGVSAGTDTIRYIVTNTCGSDTATSIITINTSPLAGTINGKDTVCIGDTIALSNTLGGGTWSTTNSNALVSGNGIVLGASAGTDSIKYTVTNPCGSATTQTLINIIDCESGVKNIPASISNSISVFPDPNHGVFTLKIYSATKENATIIITNMVGEKVKELATSTDTETKLQLNVSPGIYFISAVSEKGRATAKIVIE